MTDNEIIKAVKDMLSFEKCKDNIYGNPNVNTLQEVLELITRYKTKDEQLDKAIQHLESEIENQSKNFKILVAEHRDLQKLLEEKNAEVERYKNNVFCKVVIDEETMRNIINEKVQEFELDIEAIKAEAIKELLDKIEKQAIPNEDDVYWVELGDIYNLVKEMVGDAE